MTTSLHNSQQWCGNMTVTWNHGRSSKSPLVAPCCKGRMRCCYSIVACQARKLLVPCWNDCCKQLLSVAAAATSIRPGLTQHHRQPRHTNHQACGDKKTRWHSTCLAVCSAWETWVMLMAHGSGCGCGLGGGGARGPGNILSPRHTESVQ